MLKIYGMPLSQPVRAVAWSCLIKVPTLLRCVHLNSEYAMWWVLRFRSSRAAAEASGRRLDLAFAPCINHPSAASLCPALIAPSSPRMGLATRNASFRLHLLTSFRANAGSVFRSS